MLPPDKSLFATNKSAFADSTLQANKHLEWVQRLYQKDAPSIQLKGEPSRSTHYMGDDGNGYVFPTIIGKPGTRQLTYLGDDAEDYARDNNTGIQFKTKEQGDWFAANGYKTAPGVNNSVNSKGVPYNNPKYSTGSYATGVKSMKLQKAATGLKDILPDDPMSTADMSSGVTAGAGLLSSGLNMLQGSRTDSRGLVKGGSALGVLSSTASGVAAGASFGLPGMAIGGLVGAGMGIFQSAQADKAHAAAARAKDTADQKVQWDRVAPSANLQPSQYTMGTKKVASKVIEIEGGEPHFSAKKDGVRTLKSFAPDGPKHSEGGIAALAQEGDAIITAKDGKGAQAVAAYQRGDHQQVEKLISQMPEDKGAPKAKSGKRSISAYQPASQESLDKLTDSSLGKLEQSEASKTNIAKAQLGADIEARNPYTKLDNFRPGVDAPGKPSQMASNAVQALPSLYNLGQGLFGNADKTTRRSYTPEAQQYQDLSGSQRQASVQGMNTQVSSARNLSAGSAGNVRSNQAQAYADNATRQGAIDAQESGRRLGVDAQNVQVRNQAQLQNNAMNNQSDELDMQNRTKKQEALSKGLTGIGSIAANQQLMGNQQARDAQSKKSIGDMMTHYNLVDGSWVPKNTLAGNVTPKLKKGMRHIKAK